ncbi:MAG: nitroreductase family protein [Candidatus Omnitrophica bacterium]|nr:nitroreductase family protein [Candidatus Omnitrophota bacterium]
MNFQALVQRRRSVRRYSDKPVFREDLLKCLEAARLAPSACNSQPWHFVVINEPALKNRVAERIFSGIYSMNKFAKEAPVLVAVVSEKSRFLASIGGQVRDTRYRLVDLGIATEHFILQAEELGIGSCWIGWFDEKALKKEMKIPKDKKIDAVIALGYPVEEEVVPKNRKCLEEISSFNEYH